MTLDTVALLAQKEDGWGQLLYLLLFLVLPMLNKFGDKIRNWAAAKEEAKNAGEASPTLPPNRSPSKKPKGIAGRIQPAPPVVLKGERAVPAARPSVAQPKAPVPVARAPRTVDTGAQRRPASPSRKPAPVKARRVRPAKRREEAAPPHAPDARAQRMAAARHLTKDAPDESRAAQRGKRSTEFSLLLRHLDPQSLRSVVVLSEILKPPLALREDWPEAS